MMPKPWTIRSLLCLLLVSVPARGHVIYNKPESTLQRRQSNPSVVTGITWGDGSGMQHSAHAMGSTLTISGRGGVRREIRDLHDNYPEQWSLYLLGLAALQWSKQSDPLSYYGLASKHSLSSNERGETDQERKASTADLIEHGAIHRAFRARSGLQATVRTATCSSWAGIAPTSPSLR
jgi:hypothetical protein